MYILIGKELFPPFFLLLETLIILYHHVLVGKMADYDCIPHFYCAYIFYMYLNFRPILLEDFSALPAHAQ